MHDSYWMPFTANRQFKNNPKILSSARGIYYFTGNQKILDGMSGLWCCNLGHARTEIASAVNQQINNLDYATAFQLGHNTAFELANKLVELSNQSPSTNNLKNVFFCNSGSEAVDTSLKVALAYHKANGQPQRTILIGREKGYHGVGFGGMAVGGLENNKKQFLPLLPNVEHLPHLLDIDKNSFSKGSPKHGIEKADHLEFLIEKHGADNIAAVIVEPFSGSAGVIIPPLGYLQRLREITKKYGILLIFDEVISGFGRVGALFAAQRWGVQPDMIIMAKGLTNGVIPMGAVMIDGAIYNKLMQGDEKYIELFHGYTYSGHPVACAAALACLKIYQDENIFAQSIELENYWQEKLHSLKGLPNIIDIRNIGLAGAIEFKPPTPELVGLYAYNIFDYCFKNGLLVRHTGDMIALSPPLVINKAEIDFMINILADAIKQSNDLSNPHKI